jgi:hypothetical protein
MDPYLEHPLIFPGLHDRLIFCIGEALQPKLPEPYFAEISERAWVEVSQRLIGPDVEVLRRDDVRRRPVEVGGVAVAERAEPILVTVPHDEIREIRMEIFARGESEQLVTSIEVLSSTNKTPGNRGRELYLDKQKEILNSSVNLVEIDLLRAGTHTTAVPLERALEKTGPFDYHVCLHRLDSFEDYYVYPIQLAQPLPEIAIPLLPGDGDVHVSLQAVFTRAYDTGPYHRRVRYERDPTPPLSSKLTEWARQVLAQSAQSRD